MENALKVMHFSPCLHATANESRKTLDLIQSWRSWGLLCEASNSENIKSLLEECASCHPFRVTKGSPVSSHRSALPLKTERKRDKCVSAETLLEDDSEEIW